MKIKKTEKNLYLSSIVCLTLAIFIKIFIGASISNYKMNNEKINYQISTEKKNIESLTMQVNELTSFDNILNIVKNYGLAYNNDNIVVINDWGE